MKIGLIFMVFSLLGSVANASYEGSCPPDEHLSHGYCVAGAPHAATIKAKSADECVRKVIATALDQVAQGEDFKDRGKFELGSVSSPWVGNTYSFLASMRDQKDKRIYGFHGTFYIPDVHEEKDPVSGESLGYSCYYQPACDVWVGNSVHYDCPFNLINSASGNVVEDGKDMY